MGRYIMKLGAASALFFALFASVSAFANTAIDEKKVYIIDSIEKCGNIEYRVNDEEQERIVVFDTPSKTRLEFLKDKIHIFIPNPNIFNQLDYAIYLDGKRVNWSYSGSVRLRDDIETIEWSEEGCQIGVVATGGGKARQDSRPVHSFKNTNSQNNSSSNGGGNNGGGNNGGGNNGGGNNGGNPCGGNCGNGNGNGGGNGTGNEGNGNGPGNNNGGGNNGHGNGDQDAPGNSGGNNNAENASGSKGKGKNK